MMSWHNAWGPENWVLMGLVMVLFWAAVVATVFAVVRRNRHAPVPPIGEARRILDRRFAQGEISGDEYSHQRDLLRTA